MEWTECIGRAIDYMESRVTEDLTIEEIAKQAMVSPYYFQKGFAMLCGCTVAEYLKKRRLSLAGSELVSSGGRILDLALKYGYDSPDSFTKAFTRFHGATPTAVRRGEAALKTVAPLKIKLTLEGGSTMDYKIVTKDRFSLLGVSKTFSYEAAAVEVPKLWEEISRTGKSKLFCTMYGVSIDESMEGNEFEYLIADHYDPAREIPEGFVTREIPAFTWAVFPCKGAMPQALQEVSEKIFSEWLPGCRDYEIAAGYHVEQYDDPAEYARGVADGEYRCEIWIPVRKKQAERS